MTLPITKMPVIAQGTDGRVSLRVTYNEANDTVVFESITDGRMDTHKQIAVPRMNFCRS